MLIKCHIMGQDDRLGSGVLEPVTLGNLAHTQQVSSQSNVDQASFTCPGAHVHRLYIQIHGNMRHLEHAHHSRAYMVFSIPKHMWGSNCMCGLQHQPLCYMCTFFIVSHHHSKRAVLCVDMPYTIQRSLCVTNGHCCVIFMIQWLLWPSQTYRVSRADTQLHCVGTRHSDLAIPCPCFYTKDMCRLQWGSKRQHNKSVVGKGSLLLSMQLQLFSVK
jgi:hypothetical protein